MNQHPLNVLLHYVDSGTSDTPGGLRFFRKGSDKPLREKPWVSWAYREIEVLTDHRVRCEGPRCLIAASRGSVEFQINYEAWIERPDAEQAARGLEVARQIDHAVEDELVTALRTQITNASKTGTDLISNFMTERMAIGRDLQDRVYNRFGIRLEVSVKPVLLDRLESCSCQIARLSVRPSDCSDFFIIKCSGEISVLPGSEMLSILNFKSAAELRDLFSHWIVEVVASDISYLDLTLPTNRYATEERIKNWIDDRLAPLGRRINFISLEMESGSDLPETVEIRHSTDCAVGEFQIRVQHHLILELNDAGRYFRSKTGDLEAWVKKQVDAVSKRLLFLRSIAELIESSAECSHEIKDALGATLQQVGYSVRQITTLPNIDLREWFTYGLRLNKKCSDCATLESGFRVAVDVVINARLGGLQDPRMARYLRPESQLREDLERSIQETVEAELHRVRPQDFYLNFYTSPNQAPSVASKLEEAISEELHRRFSLTEETTIQVKIDDNAFINKLKFLEQSPHYLPMNVKTLADGEEFTTVTYTLTFRLGFSRDYFNRLLKRQTITKEEEINEIGRYLREAAQEQFGPIPKQYAAFQTEIDRLNMLHRLRTEIEVKFADIFGLAISLEMLSREATAVEGILATAAEDRLRLGEEGRLKLAASRVEHDLQEYDRHRKGLTESGALGSDLDSEEYRYRVERVKAIPNSHQIAERRESRPPVQSDEASADFWRKRNEGLTALSSPGRLELKGEDA